MKQSIVLIVFLITIGVVSAQENSCDSKNISTEPGNAINTEKPSKRNSLPTIFDWRYSAFDMNSSRSSIKLLQSPFFIDYDLSLTHFEELKDFNWEDGWELIKQEFGLHTVDYNHTTYDIKPFDLTVDYPLIVLYNKYLGKLRVFVAMTNSVATDYSDVEIILSLKNSGYNTSIFNITIYGSGEASNPVEKIISKDKNKLTAIHRYNNGGNTWCYSDFLISYDPCTCRNNSIIDLEVNLIKKADIHLTGNSDGKIVDIDDEQNKNINEVKDKSFNLNLENLTETGKKALDSYRTMSSWVGETNTRINDYYTYGPNLSYEMKEKIDKSKEIAKPSLQFLDSFIKENSLQPFLNLIPYAGAVLSIYDLFTAGGGTTQPQRVSLTPMTIAQNYTFNGVISSKTLHRQASFFVPGSKIPDFNTQDKKYPYYNQTMGVFNLLRSPQYCVKKERVQRWLEGYWFVNYNYYFKIPNQLEYTINPASGLSLDPDDIDIAVAIQIEKDSPFISTLNEYEGDGSIIFHNENTICSQYVPLGCLDDLVFKIPLNWFLMQEEPEYSIWDDFNTNPETQGWRVYVKLIVRLKRVDADDNTDRVVSKYKYLLDKNNSNPNCTNWSNALLDYPENLNFNINSIIEENAVYKCWGDITLCETVNFPYSDDNHFVTFKAGREIKITGNQRLTSNEWGAESGKIFKIEYPFSCNNPTPPPVSQTVINNFCMNNDDGNIKNYKPTFREPQPSFPIDYTLNETNRSLKIISFHISPNPASNILNISYSLPEISDTKIVISNLLGEELITVLDERNHNAGGFKKNIDITKLNSGTYFVTLISNGFRYNKNLMIIK